MIDLQNFTALPPINPQEAANPQPTTMEQGLPQPPTMTTHPETSLLGLPAELRTYTYELVLLHTPSSGIIAPVSDRYGEHCSLNSRREDYCSEHSHSDITDCMTVISGQRARVSADERSEHYFRTEEELINPRFMMPIQSSVGMSTSLVGERLATRLPARHLCTLDCLAQPGLTVVSRRVREEALPAFYSVNSFHFEMSNFHIAGGSGTCKKHGRSPMDWWRATGDTNLRCIRSLTLVGHPLNSRMESGVVMKYDGRTKEFAIVEREDLSEKDEVNEYGEQLSAEEEKERRQLALEEMKVREGKLGSFLEQIRGSGLHVRALEGMLSVLEPEEGYYLRDYGALEWGGVVLHGSGDRTMGERGTWPDEVTACCGEVRDACVVLRKDGRGCVCRVCFVIQTTLPPSAKCTSSQTQKTDRPNSPPYPTCCTSRAMTATHISQPYPLLLM